MDSFHPDNTLTSKKSRTCYKIFNNSSQAGNDNPAFILEENRTKPSAATIMFRNIFGPFLKNGDKELLESAQKVMTSEELLNDADWLQAIVADDIDSMQMILSKASDNYKKKLLRGHFTWHNKVNVTNGLTVSKFKDLSMTTSFTISVSLRSMKAINFLIENGCDVYVTEKGGYNVIHIIIIMASLNPLLELRYCKVLKIMKNLASDTYRKLLLMEDDHEARPFECAIAHDMFLLATEILNDPCSLYIKKVVPQGAYIAKTYDLTEYETTRRDMSPLFGLIFVAKPSLELPHAKAFYKSKLIQSWMKAKARRNLLFTLIWLLFRTIYVSVFFGMTVIQYLDYINFAPYTLEIEASLPASNSTGLPAILSNSERLFVFYFLLLSSALMIIFDIFDIAFSMNLRTYYYMKTFTGWKNLVVTHMFYRCSQLILSSGVFLLFLNGLQKSTAFSLDFRNFVTINITVNAIWSLMYFIQLTPWIGHFVIATQRMITDLFQFLLILVFFMIPFWLGFQRMFSQNSTRKVPVEFDEATRAMYSTFLISLNMLDLSQLESVDQTGVAIMHIMYALLIPILLFNLLIAIFSNSYSHVWQNRDLIMAVQRLALAFTIEKRLRSVFPGIYNYMDKIAFNKQHGNYFITVYELANDDEIRNRYIEDGSLSDCRIHRNRESKTGLPSGRIDNIISKTRF